MSLNQAALASAQNTQAELDKLEFQSVELAIAKLSAAETTAKVALVPDPPPPVKNAEFFGAKGDGVTDDTDAINRMFATGVAIFDQAGKTYLIDAIKRVSIPLNGSTLRCLPEAGAITFKIKKNGAPKYRGFNTNASNCDLDFGGARIIGDRDEHDWRTSSTHEWGYCFFLGGSNNRLYSSSGNAVFSKATGDCLGVTGPGHEVYGITFEYGRRQGCSAFNPAGLKFHNNKSRYIGHGGKPDPAPIRLIGPFCGFDAEPDKGDALGLEIYDNEFGPDVNGGAIGWINKNASAITPGMRITMTLTNNLFVGCSNGTHFCVEVAGKGSVIAELYNNRFVNNRNTDVKCDQGSTVTIGALDKALANTFDDTREQPDGYKPGFVSTRYEMQRLRGAVVNAGINYYV